MAAISSQKLREYSDHVLYNFPSNNGAAFETKQLIGLWFRQSLFNRDKTDAAIESEAKSLLGRIQETSGGQRRYKFVTSSKDHLIKLVFEKSFRNEPEAVISAAENIDSVKPSISLRLRKICLIKIPELLASILKSDAFLVTVISVVATAFVIFFTAYLLGLIYVSCKATAIVLSKAALIAAKFVSYDFATAIEIMIALEACTIYLVNMLMFAFGLEAADMDERRLGCFGKAMLRIGIFDIAKGLGNCLGSTMLMAVETLHKFRDDVVASLKHLALEEKKVQEAISRKKAYAIWVRAISARTP